MPIGTWKMMAGTRLTTAKQSKRYTNFVSQRNLYKLLFTLMIFWFEIYLEYYISFTICFTISFT